MVDIKQDVYNFIEEHRVVTFPLLAENFGFGEYKLASSLSFPHITAYGLSYELARALQGGIIEGKIFEISCGIKLHDILLGGVRFKSYDVAHFNKHRYKYGYRGTTWLPVVFCNDEGVREMRNVFLNPFLETNPDSCDLIIDVTDRFMSSKNPINRAKISQYFSELFDGQASDIWNNMWDTYLAKEKKMS